MHDWEAFVRQHLDLSGLAQQQQNEIVAELAAHLEDVCAEFRKRGLSESAAIERTQSELSVKNLARHIHLAKREEIAMTLRTKQLLLPGLANMAIAIVAPVLLFWIVEWFRFNSKSGAPHHVAIRFDFLLAYLFGGAAGAFLCRRAGGSRLSRAAVALLPAGAYFGCICLGTILITAFIEPGHFVTGLGFAHTTYLAVLQPGALLLLGALPFLIPGDSKKPEVIC